MMTNINYLSKTIKIAAMLMIVILPLMIAAVTEPVGAASEGWQQNEIGWWYENEDGTYPVNSWKKIGDRWYHFDARGYMQHGWLKDGNRWYYLGWPDEPDSGAMRHGWLKVDDRWYYLGWQDNPDSGAMRHGWLEVGDRWYYLGWPHDADSGAMRTGLVNTNQGISDTPKNWLFDESGAWQEDFTGMYTDSNYKSHYILNGLESKPDKVIYLTFDDGPGAYTDKLIDILDKYNAKATFFVTGNNTSYWDCVGKAYRSGHSIGNHTYSHDYSYCYSSTSAFWKDWQKTEDIIVSQTGSGSEFIRFPGGSSNNVSKSYNTGIMTRLAKQVHEYGYEYYDWNVSSGDAGETTSSSQVYKNIIDGCSGITSPVVLCHDVKSYTVDAIEDVLIWGQENGYIFMGLDKDSPVVHHGIKN